MSSKEIKNIIVVGASAGGMAAVTRLLSSFKQPVDVSIFVVIHTSENSMIDVVLNHLQKHSVFHCKTPVNDEEIANKTVYLALPDWHLLLTKGVIKVQKGAVENRWRASIDVLFRTAAAAYGSCVIGIILSGLLDDGTSGMSAIQRSGGVCIVQDPQEAEFSDMPTNVLENTNVQYKVSVDEMGYIIGDLLSRRACDTSAVPSNVKKEADITLRMSSEIEETNDLGDSSQITCPGCGGLLYKMKDSPIPRYRCYTGHSFTEKTLLESQQEALEESLWVAIRMMEERRNLLHRMLEEAGNNGVGKSIKRERTVQLQKHIERLKAMLQVL